MTITEDKKSLRHILQIIDATVILHNYLMERGERGDTIPDCWIDDDDTSSVGEALSETDELNHSLAVGAPNDTRRRQLTNYINEWFIPY